MSLRHDDELPPLTPAQQAEAIRLAARLQEEEATRHDLLAAAEEAGIEPRFMREAAYRVAAAPQTVPHIAPSVATVRNWATFALYTLGFLVASTTYVGAGRGLQSVQAGIILAVVESAILALFWTRRGRSRLFVYTSLAVAWAMLDIVLNVLFGGPKTIWDFMPVVAIETGIALAGAEIARLITTALRARNVPVGHNPKA